MNMKLFSALTALIAVTIGSATSFAQDSLDFSSAVSIAVQELIPKEIARDEDIVTIPLNIARLRQARERISKDIAEKERIVAGLKNGAPDEVAAVVSAYEATLTDEKGIVADQRINDARQAITSRVIRANIAKKKEALEAFRSWASGGGR